jgi:hypothetical protein
MTNTDVIYLKDFIKDLLTLLSLTHWLNSYPLKGSLRNQFFPEQSHELFDIYHHMNASGNQEQVCDSAVELTFGVIETREIYHKTNYGDQKSNQGDCGHDILGVQIFDYNSFDHIPMLNDMEENEYSKYQGGYTVDGSPGKILTKASFSPEAFMMTSFFHIGRDVTGNHTANHEEIYQAFCDLVFTVFHGVEN